VADVEIPNFGTLLSPYIGQVPAHARARFLALLERGAAQRYRMWAAELPAHADVLGACAASEDEIADRVEAAFTLDESLRATLTAALSDARQAYYDVFAGLDVWDQLRIQAGAERQGAHAWRNIAASHHDDAVIAELHACSALEEASAERLDRLIAAFAGTQ
jgi:microcystin-dependent protein